MDSIPVSSLFILPPLLHVNIHAEQVAINQTLLFIKENFTIGYFLIISDSLSALQSITNSPIKRKTPHCLS